MTLKSIDEKLKETEVKSRRKYLIQEIKKMGLEQARDGRRLEDLSLYSLEWMHIEEKSKAAKAFSE